MRIVFLGPPGIGKGTQANLLCRRRGLTHISTGVIIRSAMEVRSPLGEQARVYVNQGQLVPDELVRDLAEDAIATNDYDDFVLDGYPRTIVQAEWLDDFLERHGVPLRSVICLDVAPERIVDRLSKRRVHKTTGENYHLDFKPPPPGVDPSLIIQREDDKPEKIRHRLEVYAQETAPLEGYYRDRGLLHVVDGEGSIEAVHERIVALLDDELGVAEPGV